MMPTPRLDLPTLLFLYWMVLFMPFMAWVSYRKVKAGQPLAPKIERFRLGTGLLGVTALMALASAQQHSITISLHADSMSLLFAAAIVTGLLAGVARNRHRQPAAHRERISLLYAPTSLAEFRWAATAGVMAGIAEEIAYRAVLYELLAPWTGYGISLVVCVLLFVVAHLPQGMRGAVGVGAMAIIFHILYVLSGSLLPGILVHAIYDVGLFAILLMDERRQLAVHTAEQPVLFN
jgi:membrane protease YdiL (CAAX protease family)